MAMELDRLEIAINAQARTATSEIDSLYQKLGDVATGLSRTTSGFRSASREVGRLTAAFRSLASTRIPNFDKVIQQLNALSKIDFKMLTNKKINIDIGVNAPKSASDIQWAIQKAVDDVTIDSDKFANQIIKTYSLTGRAAKDIRDAVAEMTKELSSSFNGEEFTRFGNEAFEKIRNTLIESGKLRSELIGDEQRILEALNHSDLVAAQTNIGKVRSKISDISDPKAAEAARNYVTQTAGSLGEAIQASIRNSFNRAMKNASNELTLDVQVNQDKIIYDIRNAINKAAKLDYSGVEVKLNINKQGIQDNITRELQNIKAGNLDQVSAAYERLFQTLMSAHTTLGNSNSINNVVNALTRLAKVNLNTFDVDRFKEIIGVISTLASTADVSANITRLVSGLARLASIGDVMNTTAQALPALGNALRSMFDQLAGANVSEITERILMAFTRLATSGQKAATAAQNLPNVTDAVNGFFESMAQAPEISDTTLRMVEAFTALATTGKRIGSVGNQVVRSFRSIDSAGASTARTFNNVGLSSNKVINAFKKLLAACNNVAKGIGKAKEKIVNHFKEIGNNGKNVQKATLSLRNLLQVALGLYGIRTLFNWGKDAVEFASDLTEVQNVVENSFGTNGTKIVEEFAKTARDSFGMTELTAKRVASRYQAMGNAMGITSGQVAKATQNVSDKMVKSYDKVGDSMGAMSINLTKLAADMASFYNVEQETVAEALNAVYTGQTRPLRQYGLDLTQATLQEWANKQGIEGKISAMSQAEKTLLRYQYVMAQTNTIQGDFARTSDTWANQVRLLRQNLQALGGVIGGTLVNAFKPLIAWLNKAMGAVISFAETIGNALGKIFGWKILHTPASNAADAYETLSDGLESAGDSGGDAADGIGKATQAAEEYKNSVMGFDELNKLNDPTKSSSGGNGGGGSGSGSGAGGTGVGDGTGADFQIVKGESWLEDYKSEIDSLFKLGQYISDTLTKAMESIQWEKIYDKARDFGTGLASFLNGLITPELFSALGGTIAGALNTALNAAEGFLDTFDFTNLGKSIAAGINRFFNDFDFGLSARVFYKGINGIADTIVAACNDIEFERIGSRISNAVRMALANIQWKEKVYPAADSFGKGIADFLNGLIKPSTFWKIGESVASALNTALHILDTFGHTFDFKNFGKSVASAVSGYFETWDADLNADTFSTLANGVLTSISTAIGDVNWKRIGAKISGMIANIEWGTILENVGTVIMTALNGALDLASGLFDGTPISDAFEKLKSIIDSVVSQIDFDTIKNALSDILDVGLKFGAGFMSGFTTAMGVLADIGVFVLSGIGMALKTIGEALSLIDPKWVEHVGVALGIVGAALVTINGAEKVVGIVTGLKNTLFGIGTAGATAAASAEAAAAGTAAVGSSATGALPKILSVGKEFITSTGAMLGFAYTGAVSVGESMQTMEEKSLGFNGKLTEMGGIIDTLAINYLPEMQGGIRKLNDDLENSDATVDEASTAFANFFKGQHIDPKVLQTALGSARGAMNLTEDQMKLLDQIWEKFNGTTETTSGKVHGFAASIEGAKKAAGDATGIKDSLGGAMDSVKEKAEGADTKTGLFKTNIFGFAGGALAQSLLLAVLGTSFATMGDKAEGAQTPVDNLKGKISGFVEGISTWASTALSNSKDLGENVPKGMEDGIQAAKDSLDKELHSTLIDDPQNALKSGWTINSPSRVTYGYGENIVSGMANALRERGNTLTDAVKQIMNNMQTAITSRFGEFNNNGRSIANNIKTGFTSVPFSDLTNSLLNQIDFSSIYNSMQNAGQNAARAFSNGMQSTHIKTPHVTFTQSVTGEGQNTRVTWNSSVSWYKNGGFPNVGELFYARENGAPELVGSIGNRTAVANNDQIVSAVSIGVEKAVSRALGNSRNGGNGEQPVIEVTIKADSETLYRAVRKGERKASGRYSTAVAIG